MWHQRVKSHPARFTVVIVKHCIVSISKQTDQTGITRSAQQLHSGLDQFQEAEIFLFSTVNIIGLALDPDEPYQQEPKALSLGEELKLARA